MHAMAATTAMVVVTAASVIGSDGWTPNRSAAIRRLTASAPASPPARPAAVKVSPCFSTSARTRPWFAPKAIRTPISRRRSVTMYDSTP